VGSQQLLLMLVVLLFSVRMVVVLWIGEIEIETLRVHDSKREPEATPTTRMISENK